MWNALRSLKPLGFHFRRQVPLGPYYADFACDHPKLVVEIDGRTHTEADYDARRDAFMQRQGYRVLRIGNDDVLRDSMASCARYSMRWASRPRSPRLHPKTKPAPVGAGVWRDRVER